MKLGVYYDRYYKKRPSIVFVYGYDLNHYTGRLGNMLSLGYCHRFHMDSPYSNKLELKKEWTYRIGYKLKKLIGDNE